MFPCIPTPSLKCPRRSALRCAPRETHVPCRSRYLCTAAHILHRVLKWGAILGPGAVAGPGPMPPAAPGPVARGPGRAPWRNPTARGTCHAPHAAPRNPRPHGRGLSSGRPIDLWYCEGQGSAFWRPTPSNCAPSHCVSPDTPPRFPPAWPRLRTTTRCYRHFAGPSILWCRM